MSGRAQQRRGVDRLERELLVFGIDQRLDVGERRAGLHRDDQLVRFIGRHRIQRRQIEQRIGRHRLADQPLGAMADDFQRLLAGDRRAHHLLDILASRTFRVSTLSEIKFAHRTGPECGNAGFGDFDRPALRSPADQPALKARSAIEAQPSRQMRTAFAPVQTGATERTGWFANMISMPSPARNARYRMDIRQRFGRGRSVRDMDTSIVVELNLRTIDPWSRLSAADTNRWRRSWSVLISRGANRNLPNCSAGDRPSEHFGAVMAIMNFSPGQFHHLDPNKTRSDQHASICNGHENRK